MDPRRDLERIAAEGNGWTSQRARLALDIADQHAAGDISTDEMKELLEDLVRTDILEEEAGDMATRALLVTAVMGLSQIV